MFSERDGVGSIVKRAWIESEEVRMQDRRDYKPQKDKSGNALPRKIAVALPSIWVSTVTLLN